MRGVLGIDPGFSGGMAIISPEIRLATPFELNDERIDCRWLRAWLSQHSTKIESVYIERVHAMAEVGANTTFQFGRALGQVEGVVASMGFPIHYVAPQTWQKFYNFPKVPPGSTKAVKKARNLAAFVQAFPKWDLRDGPRAKNQHLGMVDAALIANYGYSSRGAS